MRFENKEFLVVRVARCIIRWLRKSDFLKVIFPYYCHLLGFESLGIVGSRS